MKKYILLFAALFALEADAQQSNPGVTIYHYVFNEFSPGIVKMKSGEMSTQVINYNTVTNEMIFNNAGKYMAIASPENVDTIYIRARKFIYLKNKFYEVLANGFLPLLLEFTSTVNARGTPSGYGGSSTTAAATSYRSLLSSGGAYELKLPDGFTVRPGYICWIMKEGKLEKASNAKQIIKFFPDKKDIINNAIQKNDLKIIKKRRYDYAF